MIKNSRGFSLIQLMIILFVVGLFIRVGMDVYSNYMNESDGIVKLNIPPQQSFKK